MNPTPADLRAAGWCLIPVRADKKPLVQWADYQSRQSTDEEIRAWDANPSRAIWAGVTGAISGRFTLDFDPPYGEATMRTLGIDPHRRTPSDGFHADFAHPSIRVATVNSKTKRMLGDQFPGLDVRGDGGYINLVGFTALGTYETLRADLAPHPLEMLPADLQVMLGLLPAPAHTVMATPDVIPATTPLGPVREEVAEALIAEGLARVARGEGRNDTGFWLACQLRDRRFTQDDAAFWMAVWVRAVPPTNAKGQNDPYTWSEAQASLEQAYRRPPRGPAVARWSILMTGRQLSDLVHEARDALVAANDPPELFLRGGIPVRLRRGDGRPVVEPLTPDALLWRLAQAADWLMIGKRDNEPSAAWPPAVVTRSTLVALSSDDLPELVDIVDTPTVRRDGTLLTEPGFDPDSGLWLELGTDLTGLRVPDHPTDDQVADALRLLTDELLGEFEFDGPASRANALALLMTPLVRWAIDGPVPLAMVTAPTAGSGKGTLCELVALISTGRPATMLAEPDGNDAELRKRITALLLAAERLICFDNCTRPVGSPVLAQAITATVWGDRLLGVSRMVSLRQNATWVVNGNNITLAGDLRRRTYDIRIDPKLAEPWRRQFQRPDILAWTRGNRRELVAATLTLARSWYSAGSPPPQLRPFGTFNDWARVIGGILEHAGVDGFLADIDHRHDDADQDAAAWATCLRRIGDEIANQLFTTRQFVTLVMAFGGQAELPSAVAAALDGYASERASTTRMGQVLREIADRRFGDEGLRVERARTDRTGVVQWRILDDRSPLSAETEQPTQIDGG